MNDDEAFDGDQNIWVESRAVRVRLSQEADAIVWLKRVGPPSLPLLMLVIMGSMHYRRILALSGSALLVLIVLSGLTWWRRTCASAN